MLLGKMLRMRILSCFLALLLPLSSGLQHIKAEGAGPEAWKFTDEMRIDIAKLQAEGGGRPPSSSVRAAASCPCAKLLLSSLGPAATFQPGAMGTYTK